MFCCCCFHDAAYHLSRDQVWLGMTVTGELIAIKQIELIESDPKDVEKEYAKIYEEVTLLKEMKHRNIVRWKRHMFIYKLRIIVLQGRAIFIFKDPPPPL